jgi:hypothetical protein
MIIIGLFAIHLMFDPLNVVLGDVDWTAMQETLIPLWPYLSGFGMALVIVAGVVYGRSYLFSMQGGFLFAAYTALFGGFGFFISLILWSLNQQGVILDEFTGAGSVTITDIQAVCIVIGILAGMYVGVRKS